LNPSFREALVHIQEAESVAAVAVVDTDGMIVVSVPDRSEDLEALAASASGIFSFLMALGSDNSLGDPLQATMEYAEGILFMGPLSESTFLVVLAESGSPLGQIRLVLRRYRPELEQYLSTL